jgi:nitroreductase
MESADVRRRCRAEADDLVAVLEAARWAATWGHRQPVRFLVGLRGDETFGKISEPLKRGNSYAKAAGALVVVCADEGEDERTARYAAVDTGAAVGALGDYDNAPPEIVERDAKGRHRMPLDEVAFAGSWGRPLPLWVTS